VKREEPVPFAALAALVLIWGYSWIVMKIGLRYAHPFDFAALRVLVATVVLFALLAILRRPLTLGSYRMAIVIGTLQVALFVALTQFALFFSGPGRTSILTFTMPFWMILFAHWILRERMRPGQWFAVALAFAGLVLIIDPWKLTSFTASLLTVTAGAVWAIAAVISKRWPTRADPLVFTAWQLLVGSLLLGALALGHRHEPVQWTTEFVAALLFSAVLATAIGWWLWTYVLARTPAGIAGLNSLGIPVVAVIGSAIQLGERPPPLELAGMIAILVALALLALPGLRRPRVPRIPPSG